MRLRRQFTLSDRGFLAALLGVVFLLTTQLGFAQSPSVQVEALFPKAAVLKINGTRKTLRVGESHDGVTLVAAQSQQATLEIGGRRQTLGLSRHIGSTYSQAKEEKVVITRDAALQYRTSIELDGRRVVALVDTGANIMSISSQTADALGIEFYHGKPVPIRTASGITNGYMIVLREVSVGGISVNNVEAVVTEGRFPETVLLGMSYLRHVKMEERDGTLSLSRTR